MGCAPAAIFAISLHGVYRGASDDSA